MPWKSEFICLPLVLLPFGLAISPVSSNAQAKWPQFHFSADRSGFTPDESVLTPDNVADLGLSWTATVGPIPLASPVVADGVVYAGSNDGNLYAFDAVTGAILWSGPTGGSILLEAAGGGGQGFVGFDGTQVLPVP